MARLPQLNLAVFEPRVSNEGNDWYIATGQKQDDDARKKYNPETFHAYKIKML